MCRPASALDPGKLIVQYGHRVWAEKDGLPQNSVLSIVQSPRGYLWLGTQEGLVRFDGVRFTVYDKENTKPMRGSYVAALCEDGKGDLWIAPDSGGLLRKRGSTFSVPAFAKDLAQVRIGCIARDREHRLWLGTDNSGALCVDGSRITRYTVKQGLPGPVVYAIYEDGHGTVWIGTNRGLATLRDGKLSTFPMPGKKHNWYYAITGDSHGNVWVGTFRGLFRIGPGRKVTRFTVKEGLSSQTVYALYTNRENHSLWIGTKGGLCRYLDGRFETYGVADGLSNGQVLSITEDREGDLWVGTADGLNRFRDDKFFSLGTKNGLLNGMITSVLQARDGSIWIGTDGGGVSRWTKHGIINITRKEGLPSNTVDTLWQDPDGTIWMGLDSGGLVKWKSGRLTRFMAFDNRLTNTAITCMLRDGAGTLWVGCANGVFSIRGTQATLLTRKDGLSGDTVTCLLEDPKRGGLWLGTDAGGLDFYKDGVFKVYTTRQGLVNDDVNALCEEGDGTLWVGTMGGLSRLRDGRFANVTRRQGLFSDTVFTILPDKAGRFWMSCNKGVFSVRRSELESAADGQTLKLSCDAYGRSDGMGSSECNGGVQPSGCVTRGGWLCVATVRGLAVLDPSAIHLNLKPPPVVIEDMRVDGRSFPLSPRLQIPPGRHRIEFRFTALSLVAPEKELFKYRLEGYDSGWVDAATHREAVYTGLPPGGYTFKVIACNNDGVWNKQGASLAFTQLPHFYQTWWFLVLVVLVASATVFGAVALRLAASRRREAALSRLVEERTALLEDRSRQLETANCKLRDLSNRDVLTGVANRRRFEAVVDTEWRRGARTGLPLSILMADIDHFKPYNDAYGHQRGDECLKRVAEAMSGGLKRAGDLLARYGGEEFVVILPGHTEEVAASVAERLRAAVEDLRIPTTVSGVAPNVTISIGVATVVPREKEQSETLVAAADEALYRAKREGRNRVCMARTSGA